MIHPLFHLISTRPHLLAEHVGAYGELAGEELVRLVSRWRRQAIFTAIAIGGVAAGTLFAGIAAMLWAVSPNAGERAHWVLICIPLLPILMALACLLAARSAASEEGMFDTLKEQFGADMAMLRSITATSR